MIIPLLHANTVKVTLSRNCILFTTQQIRILEVAPDLTPRNAPLGNVKKWAYFFTLHFSLFTVVRPLTIDQTGHETRAEAVVDVYHRDVRRA